MVHRHRWARPSSGEHHPSALAPLNAAAPPLEAPQLNPPKPFPTDFCWDPSGGISALSEATSRAVAQRESSCFLRKLSFKLSGACREPFSRYFELFERRGQTKQFNCGAPSAWRRHLSSEVMKIAFLGTLCCVDALFIYCVPRLFGMQLAVLVALGS